MEMAKSRASLIGPGTQPKSFTGSFRTELRRVCLKRNSKMRRSKYSIEDRTKCREKYLESREGDLASYCLDYTPPNSASRFGQRAVTIGECPRPTNRRTGSACATKSFGSTS